MRSLTIIALLAATTVPALAELGKSERGGLTNAGQTEVTRDTVWPGAGNGAGPAMDMRDRNR